MTEQNPNQNRIQGVEDVEGHCVMAPEAVAELVMEDVDDVTGHVQPRRDLDIER